MSKTAKTICLLLICFIVIWAFFLRDPISADERNADRLEERDRAKSEKILEEMPVDLQTAMKEILIPEYNDHLIFLKNDDDYYAMVNVSGTFLHIDTETFSAEEVFSLHKFVCDIEINDNKVTCLTGKRESRDKRSLGSGFIHKSQVSVLTDIEKYSGDLEE